MHRHHIASAAAPFAIGLALAGSAYAVPLPATGPPPLGTHGLPADAPVPPRVEGATVEHRWLAISLTCGEDGVVRVRGVGMAAFRCAEGKALARLSLSSRLRRGRLRIDARVGSMSVTRTLRLSVARARLAAETISINGGYQYAFRGCATSPGWRRTYDGWVRWYGTTAACSWDEYAGDYLMGKLESYLYLSTSGTWIEYRIRKCGVGSGECRWIWARPGF